jgi:hypothetical protein
MTFVPSFYYVSNITNANPAVVTTTTDHNFQTGMVARMRIPYLYGMQQMNNQIYSVSVLSSTSVSLQYTQVPVAVNVDSTFFDTYVNAAQKNTPQIVAVGAGPTPVFGTVRQTLNNECEYLLDDQVYNNSTVEIPF